MRILKIIIVFIVIFSLGMVGIRIYNDHRLHVEKETRFMMDTFVSISAVGPKEISTPAISAALDRIQEIDVKFNAVNPKSPVYAFNKKGSAITDPEILDLVRLALKISKETAGAFDITVYPLTELWGFNGNSPHLPADQDIKKALGNVGYQHLLLKDGKLEKDSEGVEIDFGGIAKGYALDQAVRVLKAKGITQALVDAGGDICTLGKKGSRLWKVGIRNPRGDEGYRGDALLGHIETGEGGLLGFVEVEDLAVMGSGDYERFFIKDGKRYHHIFDPKTGYPTEGVAAVTLIYNDPVSAQPWNKIPFVLGPKKGLEMLAKIPGMEAIVITTSGEKIYSAGLRHALNVIPKIQ